MPSRPNSHLTITTRQIYFRGLGHSKSCKTPLEEIAGLSKTKSLRMFVWYSSGLQIARTNKRSLFFSNMVKRDECFNLILAVGSDGELARPQLRAVHIQPVSAQHGRATRTTFD